MASLTFKQLTGNFIRNIISACRLKSVLSRILDDPRYNYLVYHKTVRLFMACKYFIISRSNVIFFHIGIENDMLGKYHSK